MSDAIEALRAIDAIPARLADRMADALVDLEGFDRKGTRYVAYLRAGIAINSIPSAELHDADLEAHSIELGRRFP